RRTPGCCTWAPDKCSGAQFLHPERVDPDAQPARGPRNGIEGVTELAVVAGPDEPPVAVGPEDVDALEGIDELVRALARHQRHRGRGREPEQLAAGALGVGDTRR